jgi:hypothetical protein
VVITIPRGAYAPEFVQRDITKSVQVQSELPANHEEAPIPRQNEAERPVINSQRPVTLYWLMFVSVVLASILSSVSITRYVLMNKGQSAIVGPNGATRDFLGTVF